MSVALMTEQAANHTAERDLAPSPTILVVEDEALIRVTATDALRDCGYTVIEAANGDQAMALLMAGDIHVDVVFSDVRMPGMTDGFSLARWVRANRPDMRVLLTSGYIGSAALSCDVHAHGRLLSKPYDYQDLVDRLQQLSGDRAPSRDRG